MAPYFSEYVKGNEYWLAQHLAKRYDLTVLTTLRPAPREAALVNPMPPVGDDYDLVAVPSLADPGDFPVASVAPLIRRGGYDALLLMEDYSPLCHSAMLAAHCPYVVSTERTFRPPGLKGGVLAGLDATWNRLVRDGAAMIACHSTLTMKHMRSLRVPEEKLTVIPVGVDTTTFKPTFPAPREATIVLCVARHHPYKGLLFLLRAAEMLPSLQFFIQGRGPLLESHEEHARRHGLDNVHFLTTPVPNDCMPMLYSTCDAYVQPSLVEPYGIAPLEAMACGRPVVVTSACGMSEHVGLGGRVVPPADPAALAEAIRSQANDPGAGGRARMASLPLDWAEVARQYIALIEQLEKKR